MAGPHSIGQLLLPLIGGESEGEGGGGGGGDGDGVGCGVGSGNEVIPALAQQEVCTGI